MTQDKLQGDVCSDASYGSQDFEEHFEDDFEDEDEAFEDQMLSESPKGAASRGRSTSPHTRQQLESSPCNGRSRSRSHSTQRSASQASSDRYQQGRRSSRSQSRSRSRSASSRYTESHHEDTGRSRSQSSEWQVELGKFSREASVDNFDGGMPLPERPTTGPGEVDCCSDPTTSDSQIAPTQSDRDQPLSSIQPEQDNEPIHNIQNPEMINQIVPMPPPSSSESRGHSARLSLSTAEATLSSTAQWCVRSILENQFADKEIDDETSPINLPQSNLSGEEEYLSEANEQPDAMVNDDFPSASSQEITPVQDCNIPSATFQRELECAEQEDEDGEVAAIIASARAVAMLRPDAANPGSMWEERAVTAAVQTASKAAVEFGPVGTPPPDADACSGPGWVRDASVQCGPGSVRSSSSEVVRAGSCFSPARTGGWSRRLGQDVEEKGVQTKLSGNAAIGRTNSEIRLNLQSSPLETVDEGERDEPETPHQDGIPGRFQHSVESSNDAFPAAQHRPPGAPLYRRPQASSSLCDNSATPFVGGPYLHTSAQSKQEISQIFPQHPEGQCFGRVLEEQYCRRSPAGCSPLSARGPKDVSQQLLLPMTALQLHRLCDPMTRIGRRNLAASQPRSTNRREGRSPSPIRLGRSRPPPTGLEARPPAVEVRQQAFHSKAMGVMSWEFFGHDAPLPPFVGVKHGFKSNLKATVAMYAPKDTSHLYSLGFAGARY